MKKIIPALAFLILICSCNREYNCTNGNLKLNFIGYSGADIDTIVIRQFAPNTNFHQLTDTALFIIDSTSLVHNNDTTSLNGNRADNFIHYGSDWQIFLPSKNKTIAISNIISPQQQGKCSAPAKVACVCSNPVQSLVQDSTTNANPIADASAGGYKVFIHN